MRKIEGFIIQHPIGFGFALTLVFILLSVLAWPLTQVELDLNGYPLGESLAKLAMAIAFLGVLAGLGWTKAAGQSRIGAKSIWRLVLVIVFYKAFCGMLAFTGSFQVTLPASSALGILIFTLATALLEEIMYRGLLLTALVKAWGSTRRGLFAAALVSGFFFGSMHLVNLGESPFPLVALQVLEATLSGFVYAALVLAVGNLWPAILGHWVLNAGVSLAISQIPDFVETEMAWLLLSLATLPLVWVARNLLHKVALNPPRENDAQPVEM
jgi:membrane protease YdiL (CAAX protease family)